MSAISVRLPNSLHEAVRELAERENISINQFITLALAEKISALMTEEYLSERAERASREKFEAVLAKVPDVEPPDYDRL
ncbi:MAG: toxin-antitoxin system HicB family antitoxin [Anaerolineae bacterium]|nr:toxin-antitoxin system HicB family antitoxin [Anaerolineae bacterium]